MPTPNSLSGQVWVLTDPDEDVPVKRGPTIMHTISWEGYTSTSHTVLLRDRDNNIIFDAVGKSDLSPIGKTFDRPVTIWDLRLVALGSGRVLVNV